MPKNANTVRVSVDLTNDQLQRLERVKEQAGLRSKADVFREALQLYEFFVQQADAGERILLEKDGAQREVVIFR